MLKGTCIVRESVKLSFRKCLGALPLVPSTCGSQVLVSRGCMRVGVRSFYQGRECDRSSHLNLNLTRKCDFGIPSWHASARNVCASAGGSKGSKDGGTERLYHPELSSAEKKAKRAQAHRMGKSLVTCNMGAKGITLAWLESLFGTLRANQLVKVRLGGNERDATAEELCALLDCVCVQSIGSVLVLYRQKGLPDPVRLQRMREQDRITRMEGSAADNQEENGSDTNGSQRNEIGNTKRGRTLKDEPPEFTIIN